MVHTLDATLPSTSTQRAVVRDLARQVAELAATKENELIKRRWRDVNALRKPDRAPVWCKPVDAWKELLPPESLSCQDPHLRALETEFRRILIKRQIADDTPIENHFGVAAIFDVDPPNIWGLDIRHHAPKEAGGAWSYDPPLVTDADFDKLRLPTFTFNRAETDARLSRVGDLLGDILPVKLVCSPPLSATLVTPAAELRGLMQIMIDTLDRPDLLHRLMAHLRDSLLRAMDQVAATGLLTPNNIGPMICSDPLAPEPADGKYTYKHCWCQLNSQEVDQIGPKQWEEFCLDYQKPILERFGLAQYGCCENLTQKIEGVRSIPNLRIFVCSAWTDLNKVIEKIGRRHTIMWRQKATEVVFPEDTGSIKRHLDDGLRRLKGCYVQVVLRELQTLAGHPDRLHAWARLAKDAAARHA